MLKEENRSREESEVAGFFIFSHIQVILDLVRVNECPTWLETRPFRIIAPRRD